MSASALRSPREISPYWVAMFTFLQSLSVLPSYVVVVVCWFSTEGIN